jgi:hypothetical protein
LFDCFYILKIIKSLWFHFIFSRFTILLFIIKLLLKKKTIKLWSLYKETDMNYFRNQIHTTQNFSLPRHYAALMRIHLSILFLWLKVSREILSILNIYKKAILLFMNVWPYVDLVLITELLCIHTFVDICLEFLFLTWSNKDLQNKLTSFYEIKLGDISTWIYSVGSLSWKGNNLIDKFDSIDYLQSLFQNMNSIQLCHTWSMFSKTKFQL